MNAGQITGSALATVGLGLCAMPASIIGVPCGPAAYAVAHPAAGACRGAGMGWVIFGAVLLVGGALLAAASEPARPVVQKMPVVEVIAWVAIALVVSVGVVAYLSWSGTPR